MSVREKLRRRLFGKGKSHCVVSGTRTIAYPLFPDSAYRGGTSPSHASVRARHRQSGRISRIRLLTSRTSQRYLQRSQGSAAASVPNGAASGCAAVSSKRGV